MRIKIAVAMSMPLVLSGCITAKTLNSQIGDAQKDVADITSPTFCPGQSKVPALRTSSIDIKGDDTENLEIGRSLILASAEQRARSGKKISIYSSQNYALPFGATNTLSIDPSLFASSASLLNTEGAQIADDVVDTSALRKLTDQFDRSRQNDETISISKDEWTVLLKNMSKATAENGWTSSFAIELGRISSRHKGKTDTLTIDEQQALTRKFLLAAYMEAYFRNGEIFKLDFNIPQVQDKLKDTLKKHKVSDDVIAAATSDINDLSSSYIKKLCPDPTKTSDTCTLLGVIGEQTFVSRSGKSYGFPGITGTIDLLADRKVSTNKINANDTVTDVVRVAIEALGDSIFAVPGAANSTFCKETNKCASSDQAKMIEAVDNAGDKAESATLSAIGIAIRGGWFISLNNDLLADSISTAGAVAARKLAEGAAWDLEQNCQGTSGSRQKKYESFKLTLSQ